MLISFFFAIWHAEQKQFSVIGGIKIDVVRDEFQVIEMAAIFALLQKYFACSSFFRRRHSILSPDMG